MSKIKFVPSVNLSITPSAGIKFSDELQNRIKAVIPCEKYDGIGKVTVTTSPDRIFVAMHIAELRRTDIRKVIRQMEEQLVILIEHGSDSDLLNELLKRHPEVIKHPDVSKVIGAYENLRRVLKNLESGEEVPATKFEKYRMEVTGDNVPLSDLGTTPNVTAKAGDRAEHRTKALLGQTASQTKSAAGDTYVPPYYTSKMVDKYNERIMAADRGNVFNG